MRVRFTPLEVNPQTNDNCPLRHSPTSCYIVHIRRSRDKDEGWSPQAPAPNAIKCNQMQRELSFATPTHS